jgi:hypothetical protein
MTRISALKGRRFLVGMCAALAALALAAVALAATPSKGTHKGKTSQDRLVQIKVNKNHRIKRLRVDWKAPCDNPGATWGPDTTVDIDGSKDKIKQPGDGSFSDKGSYKTRPDKHNFVAHVNATENGTFTSGTAANGTFEVKLRITKNGKTVDHCHKKVTWHIP